MNFTPKNSTGFQALQKELLLEMEILKIKYNEILNTNCYEKARRFLSYKSLMNKSTFSAMRTNIILLFIYKISELKIETNLLIKTFFNKLGINLEDLVLKTENNTEYELLYTFINLLIKNNLLLEARKLLNTARKNKWITVRYFKYLKLLNRKLTIIC